MNDLHHITVNGIPYCVAEGRWFGYQRGPGFRVPTNCAHATKAEAEQGIAECKKQQPDPVYAAVPGPCHHDPYWQTPEGREQIRQEDELNEMRFS